MFDELYFAVRTNDSRIQDSVYIYLKEDIRIIKQDLILSLKTFNFILKKDVIWNSFTFKNMSLVDFTKQACISRNIAIAVSLLVVILAIYVQIQL